PAPTMFREMVEKHALSAKPQQSHPFVHLLAMQHHTVVQYVHHTALPVSYPYPCPRLFTPPVFGHTLSLISEEPDDVICSLRALEPHHKSYGYEQMAFQSLPTIHSFSPDCHLSHNEDLH